MIACVIELNNKLISFDAPFVEDDRLQLLQEKADHELVSVLVGDGEPNLASGGNSSYNRNRRSDDRLPIIDLPARRQPSFVDVGGCL